MLEGLLALRHARTSTESAHCGLGGRATGLAAAAPAQVPRSSRRQQASKTPVPLSFPCPPASVQEFDDFEDEDFQQETDPDQAEYWRSDWDTDDVSDEFSIQLKQELQRKPAAVASQ